MIRGNRLVAGVLSAPPLCRPWSMALAAVLCACGTRARGTGHSQTPRRGRAWLCPCRRTGEPASRACLRQVGKKPCATHAQGICLHKLQPSPFASGGSNHSLRAGSCPQAASPPGECRAMHRPRRGIRFSALTKAPFRARLHELGAAPAGRSPGRRKWGRFSSAVSIPGTNRFASRIPRHIRRRRRNANPADGSCAGSSTVVSGKNPPKRCFPRMAANGLEKNRENRGQKNRGQTPKFSYARLRWMGLHPATRDYCNLAIPCKITADGFPLCQV